MGNFIFACLVSTDENFRSQHMCFRLYVEDVKIVFRFCCPAESAMGLEKQTQNRCADSKSTIETLYESPPENSKTGTH